MRCEIPCTRRFGSGAGVITLVSSVRPIAPVEVTEPFVLAKCDYFVDVQLWPLHSHVDPRRWLQNFTDEERPYAIHLLNALLYYAEPLIDQLFVAAFQGLSRYLRGKSESLVQAQAAWRAFVDNAIVTPVPGERPHSTDSGNLFARKARDQVPIPESRILTPEVALREIISRPRPVVFIDDFVGSGNQFLTMWKRPLEVTPSFQLSFEKYVAAQRGGVQFFYCPAICTEYGFGRVASACPDVIVSPAHTLSGRYNATAPDSILWPPHLLPEAAHVLEEASIRAGIGSAFWKGFHGLGLALAFSHGVPDATLPLIWWHDNGWLPLVHRT